MKAFLFAALLAFGVAALAGCSSSSPTQPAGTTTPAAKDSGAGTTVDGKKGPRVPAQK